VVIGVAVTLIAARCARAVGCRPDGTAVLPRFRPGVQFPRSGRERHAGSGRWPRTRSQRRSGAGCSTGDPERLAPVEERTVMNGDEDSLPRKAGRALGDAADAMKEAADKVTATTRKAAPAKKAAATRTSTKKAGS